MNPMSGEDARHIRELETRCGFLEQAVLIQEKRVWSQDMLKALKRKTFMAGATNEEKLRTQRLLEGNLRVAKEFLDGIARDLGYERPTVFKLLEPEFVYGAPGPDVGEQLTKQLELIDQRERESGTSHISSMLRELKTRHDEFLREVQEHVQRDVELHAIFAELVAEEPAAPDDAGD
jgi:hypothetical protein